MKKINDDEFRETVAEGTVLVEFFSPT